MLLPLCNHHQFLLAPQTLLNPSPQVFFFFFPTTLSQTPTRLPLKPLVRRASTTVPGAADTRTLPQSAIQRIAEKLRSLGYVEEEHPQTNTENANPGALSPGQIFVPLPAHLPKNRVGHTLDPSWSTPDNPVPEPGSGNAIQRFHELRHGLQKEKEQQRLKRREERKERAPTLAELTLPEDELKRLRALGIGLKKKLKIGKAGITEGIVNGIHERWRRSELVKITCEDICRTNMKRTHELLERKTGGLVVWRSGSNIIVYRGTDYKYPYFFDHGSMNATFSKASSNVQMDCEEGTGRKNQSGLEAVELGGLNSSSLSHPPVIQGVGSPNRFRFQLPGEAQLAEEADRLLEGLGPRFIDWWGYDPLPVDGDLLPATVPGYRRPFRLLPYGVKPKLTNDEMTILKRLGRPLPCHFALGRNRKLQGLAASIVKLWEKCEIAKIAIKRGVQNTNSELMVEELKRLTGGTLLSRDKEFIVIYRGKDFLPAAVSSAIEERRKHTERESNTSILKVEEHESSTVEHTCEDEPSSRKDQKHKPASNSSQLQKTEAAIKRTSTKLSLALEKKAVAEKLLAELEKEQISQEPEIDKEGITEEERYMMRKVGLRMKPFLLLGRRGVFDGTVENMHLHWKYRELVKVITGRKSIEEIHGIARTLEAESGGILVAVERVNKGYAIIIYRGKNYTRPASLRPQTLLSKKEALKRFQEAQRAESLKLHVLRLDKNIENLELQLAKAEKIRMQPDKELKIGLDRAPEVETIQSAAHGIPNMVQEPNNLSYSGSPCSQEELENKADTATDTSEPDPLCELVDKEKDVPVNFKMEDGNVEAPSDSIIFKLEDQKSSSANTDTEPQNCDKSATGTCANSQKSKLERSVNAVLANGRGVMPLQTVHLSNRERLLLRKQALKMKRIPVLAVGKSNIVTGVAKSLKAHFEKHPLAIVNVKGRAKGTSVQEVVFKLEQETGAILVSQEPSKVILYRGWGAPKEPSKIRGNVGGDLKGSASVEDRSQLLVSPELISAMRFECGLRCD